MHEEDQYWTDCQESRPKEGLCQPQNKARLSFEPMIIIIDPDEAKLASSLDFGGCYVPAVDATGDSDRP